MWGHMCACVEGWGGERGKGRRRGRFAACIQKNAQFLEPLPPPLPALSFRGGLPLSLSTTPSSPHFAHRYAYTHSAGWRQAPRNWRGSEACRPVTCTTHGCQTVRWRPASYSVPSSRGWPCQCKPLTTHVRTIKYTHIHGRAHAHIRAHTHNRAHIHKQTVNRTGR